MKESALRKVVREEIKRTINEQEPNRRFLEMVEEVQFDLEQLSAATETREQERLVERMREILRNLKDTSDYTYVRRSGNVKPKQ